MKPTALMGIENEFKLLRAGMLIPGNEAFPKIIERLPIPYFKKTEGCVRLATGGSFYIDGNEPEVTTAPFYIEPGAVTGLAHNLHLNLNCVLEGLEKADHGVSGTLAPRYLQGYSAHYSFTFPKVAEKASEVAYLLAQTVNPAVHLFVENRKSSGVMFRYREQGRMEICGDYVPDLDNVIAAVSFQAAVLHTLDRWLEQSATLDDIKEKLRYYSPSEQVAPVHSRQGYALRLPQVIREGRRAKLDVFDAQSSFRYKSLLSPIFSTVNTSTVVTAQELLEHFYELAEPASREILSADEQKILLDRVQGKEKLAIDSTGYPVGYTKVRPLAVDPQRAVSPLTTAFGNAVAERKVDGGTLAAQHIGWREINFSYAHNGSSGQVWIPLDDLVSFDRLLEQHPEFLPKIVTKTLSEAELQVMAGLGVKEPYAWLVSKIGEEGVPGTYHHIISFFPELPQDTRLGELMREYYPLSGQEFLEQFHHGLFSSEISKIELKEKNYEIYYDYKIPLLSHHIEKEKIHFTGKDTKEYISYLESSLIPKDNKQRIINPRKDDEAEKKEIEQFPKNSRPSNRLVRTLEEILGASHFDEVISTKKIRRL